MTIGHSWNYRELPKSTVNITLFHPTNVSFRLAEMVYAKSFITIKMA